ncbi:hypothetical protein [Rhizobium ruizarguesonis]|uniref:hypothetical protein n=1 Tax=Rhizobium ruizarguesonis TaxID=2081791 RepID=UPI0018D503DB|nr:hypothetical protein [Rhizobium ruizarguesonis]
MPTVSGSREFHPKILKDFLAGVTLGAQVYDPRHEALMIRRNLQLIACIDDDRLEEFDIVTVNREIRKLAQFPPFRKRQRASTSLKLAPKTKREIIARMRPQSSEILIVSNDSHGCLNALIAMVLSREAEEARLCQIIKKLESHRFGPRRALRGSGPAWAEEAEQVKADGLGEREQVATALRQSLVGARTWLATRRRSLRARRTG